MPTPAPNDERPNLLQSAAIPWRRDRRGGLSVALITNRSGDRWIIPKGIVDPGETPSESAARECREEAGLLGIVSDEAVGSFSYVKSGCVCIVDVYLLSVQRELTTWDEQSFRRRAWYSVREAFQIVQETEVRELLGSLESLIRNGS